MFALCIALQSVSFIPGLAPSPHAPLMPNRQAVDMRMNFYSTEPKITIFSLNSCKPCRAAKQIFDMCDWPFNDISITDFPERRSDCFAMIPREKLRPDGTTTFPQIFFGDSHLGGASDIAAILQRSPQTLQNMYDSAAPSRDPRKRPTNTPVATY